MQRPCFLSSKKHPFSQPQIAASSSFCRETCIFRCWENENKFSYFLSGVLQSPQVCGGLRREQSRDPNSSPFLEQKDPILPSSQPPEQFLAIKIPILESNTGSLPGEGGGGGGGGDEGGEQEEGGDCRDDGEVQGGCRGVEQDVELCGKSRVQSCTGNQRLSEQTWGTQTQRLKVIYIICQHKLYNKLRNHESI